MGGALQTSCRAGGISKRRATENLESMEEAQMGFNVSIGEDCPKCGDDMEELENDMWTSYYCEDCRVGLHGWSCNWQYDCEREDL